MTKFKIYYKKLSQFYVTVYTNSEISILLSLDFLDLLLTHQLLNKTEISLYLELTLHLLLTNNIVKSKIDCNLYTYKLIS